MTATSPPHPPRLIWRSGSSGLQVFPFPCLFSCLFSSYLHRSIWIRGYMLLIYKTIGFTLVSSIYELVWTVFHVFISYYEQDNLNLIINVSNFLKLCLIASNWKSTNSRKIQSIYYYSFSVLMFSIIQVIEWTFGRKKKCVANLRFL